MSSDAKNRRLQELSGQRCISSIGSVNRLNSEDTLTPYEVASLVAYGTMLGSLGLSEDSLLSSIVIEIEKLEKDFLDDNSLPTEVRADIYSFIDNCIYSKYGERFALAKVGLARESFEALYLRLWMRDRCLFSMRLLLNLQEVLVNLANHHLEVQMPVYSSMQPIKNGSLSTWWLATVERLRRDFERLQDCFSRTNICPLSHQFELNSQSMKYPLQEQDLLSSFGFNSISGNSLDAITDCDSVLEITSCASVIGLHLSQLANELSIWSSWEFGYVRLPRQPIQSEIYGELKKNPFETIRGSCSKFSGDFMNTLLEQKGLHVSYSKDLRGQVPTLAQMFGNLEFVLELTSMVLPVMIFDTEKMTEQANIDLANSGGIFDYLVERSYKPDKARKITANLLEYCKQRKKQFMDLTLGEWQEFSPGFDKEVYQYLSSGFESTKAGGLMVHNQMQLEEQIKSLQEQIKEDRQNIDSKLAKFLNNPCEDGQTNK